jgi:hypothetical protein
MFLDNLIRKFLKLFPLIFWFLMIIILLNWYALNKEEFFPKREIKSIPNPINPFK